MESQNVRVARDLRCTLLKVHGFTDDEIKAQDMLK